jgi:hypothetical protein
LAEYLDLADYVLIAEAVLGVSAQSIARWAGIGLADSALQAQREGSFAVVESCLGVVSVMARAE